MVREFQEPQHTRAYENAIKDFMQFTGIARPEEFRTVTRAQVIAWRDDLHRREDIQSGARVRHRLAALSSLFEYLCEKNAVSHNPVKGVKRPSEWYWNNPYFRTGTLGRHMRNMTIRVLAADLAREMVAMREWLDLNRCEPARFDCRKSGAQVALSVDFRMGVAAEGFARRFGGDMVPQHPSSDSSP